MTTAPTTRSHMKHRLNDDDQDALFWLAQVCRNDRPRRGEKPANDHLRRVHIYDGWAYASDTYRLLALPVDIAGRGSVAAHQALVGGTVDIAKAAEPNMAVTFARKIKAPRRNARCVFDDLNLNRLRLWLRRTPCDATMLWFRPPAVTGGDGIAVFGDGTWMLSNGDLLGTIQAPWLASLAIPLTERWGTSVEITGDAYMSQLALTPGDAAASFADGWGVVMPIRRPITAMPAAFPKSQSDGLKRAA